MTEQFCPEGLNLPSGPGDVVLTGIEARIISAMLEQVIAGNDVSGYAEEAGVILGGLRGQIHDENKT